MDLTPFLFFAIIIIRNVADEFEEIAGEDYVISKEEFVEKHLGAYKGISNEAFDEWIIDVCKLHEHTDKELAKFGIQKASTEYLGGIPEEEMLRRNKEKALAYCSEEINKLFYEVLIAPSFSSDALDLLKGKKMHKQIRRTPPVLTSH